jgi:hypothetical protein
LLLKSKQLIISPPFLLSHEAPLDQEMKTAEPGDAVAPNHDVCLAGMQECAPGNGAYPVSYSLSWHGGPHLIGPHDARGDVEPVRAIADVLVVYVRQTDRKKKPALHYRAVRTDDGCVVVRHTTEIGEEPNGTITFFSIYMHLKTVVSGLAV